MPILTTLSKERQKSYEVLKITIKMNSLTEAYFTAIRMKFYKMFGPLCDFK